jgi:hypothetical protein
MFQPDRIHPVIAAQEKLLDNVLACAQTLLANRKCLDERAPRREPAGGARRCAGGLS